MIFVLLMVSIVSSYKMDIGRPDLPLNEISSIVRTCFFSVAALFSPSPFPTLKEGTYTSEDKDGGC